MVKVNGRLRHPVVAFAVLTDHRLSKCNPPRGISDDVNAKALMEIDAIDTIDTIDTIDAIED